MPRAKYTKPPGWLPAVERIERSKFRFRAHQWQRLARLLPPKWSNQTIPSDYIANAATMPHAPRRVLKTVADVVVHETEGAINSYQTSLQLFSDSRHNPANVRAAIRRLRAALEPFVQGGVDAETSDIIPADLDGNLAAREQELSRLRVPPMQRRFLVMLCALIGGVAKSVAANCNEIVCEHDIVRYADAALTFANIKHPDFAKHRDRLARWVFPTDQLPH